MLVLCELHIVRATHASSAPTGGLLQGDGACKRMHLYGFRMWCWLGTCKDVRVDTLQCCQHHWQLSLLDFAGMMKAVAAGQEYVILGHSFKLEFTP